MTPAERDAQSERMRKKPQKKTGFRAAVRSLLAKVDEPKIDSKQSTDDPVVSDEPKIDSKQSTDDPVVSPIREETDKRLYSPSAHAYSEDESIIEGVVEITPTILDEPEPSVPAIKKEESVDGRF
jgi:cell envelope opacity-associated protein A